MAENEDVSGRVRDGIKNSISIGREVYLNHLSNLPSVYPRVTTKRNIHDTLEIRTCGDFTTFYIEGISVVSYSSKPGEHFGIGMELRKSDLSGNLIFNTDFFKRFDFKRPLESDSDMENIAKTFFKVNGNNFVALLQYLSEDGTSSEHYHTLEESIAQLAGRSAVELRPVKNDTEYRIVELSAGDILRIPPNHLHFVRAIEGGSLTVPLKQTLVGKKDHLYVPKSYKRIEHDLDALLSLPYSSGNEAVSVLQKYKHKLKSERERKDTKTILNRKLDFVDNPNIRRILEEIIN